MDPSTHRDTQIYLLPIKQESELSAFGVLKIRTQMPASLLSVEFSDLFLLIDQLDEVNHAAPSSVEPTINSHWNHRPCIRG
ncbi:unnamed protein product [Victoria cruziana]